MDWQEAVAAMRVGYAVRRVAWRAFREGEVVEYQGEIPIVERGVEPVTLVAAWSGDDKPVSVFRGAWSRVDCIPEDDWREATDW